MSGAVTVARVAAQALGRDVSAVSCATRIKHGLTNESWQVQLGQETLIVRLSNTAADALQIDRVSEARVLETVAAVGVGPPVVLCDPHRQVLVTRYVGPTWTLEQAGKARNIDRLALLLRRLHRLVVPAAVRQVDLMATVEGYVQTLQQHAAGGQLVLQPLRERARQVGACLREGASRGLCHNDVHHLNIVEMSGLCLIDWEYAGVGEPMFDLASACVYHRYDRARRHRLLTAYLSGRGMGEVRPDTRVTDAARGGAPETRLDALCDIGSDTAAGAGFTVAADLRRDASGNVGHWQRLELACWLFEYVRDLWAAVRELPVGPTACPQSVSPRRPPPP